MTRNFEVTAIIGNGTSAKWRIDQGEANVVACNIPQHGHRYTALSIIDRQPITVMKNIGWRPRVPVYCSSITHAQAIKDGIEGEFHQVYENRHKSNSGHWAAWYWQKYTTKAIHLYGMDSLISGDLKSQMDDLVPRPQRPDLTQQWYPFWREIFELGSHLTWYLHVGAGEDSKITAPNLQIIEHKQVFATDIL